MVGRIELTTNLLRTYEDIHSVHCFLFVAWLSGSHLGLPSGSPGFKSDRRTKILRSLSFNSGLLSFKKPETVLWTTLLLLLCTLFYLEHYDLKEF